MDLKADDYTDEMLTVMRELQENPEIREEECPSRRSKDKGIRNTVSRSIDRTTSRNIPGDKLKTTNSRCDLKPDRESSRRLESLSIARNQDI